MTGHNLAGLHVSVPKTRLMSSLLQALREPTEIPRPSATRPRGLKVRPPGNVRPSPRAPAATTAL